MRFAFANIDPAVGRVFFGKWVALPFLRFRMLRHGFLLFPFHVKEIDTVSAFWPISRHLQILKTLPQAKFKGIWAVKDPVQTPDVVVYYIHGTFVHDNRDRILS